MCETIWCTRAESSINWEGSRTITPGLASTYNATDHAHSTILSSANSVFCAFIARILRFCATEYWRWMLKSFFRIESASSSWQISFRFYFCVAETVDSPWLWNSTLNWFTEAISRNQQVKKPAAHTQGRFSRFHSSPVLFSPAFFCKRKYASNWLARVQLSELVFSKHRSACSGYVFLAFILRLPSCYCNHDGRPGLLSEVY